MLAADGIRALLVDDEEPARHRLRGLLEEVGGVDVVGEAVDGAEALERIATEAPDLVFLDIQMPGMSGLEVAAALPPPRPRVIFCTAFDQYAIDAFEHHATDYLLKPVGLRRLTQSVERVKSALRDERVRAFEVDAASRAQERMRPQRLPPMRRLDYAGACRAARGVGGDYYDFLPLPGGKLGLALADVSGKGMFAGLLVAGLQARLQGHAARFGDDVAAAVVELNRTMHDSTDSNRYATLFYGVFDDATGALRYVNAGHNPPLVLRNDGETTRLAAGGTVVGLLPDVRYAASSLTLGPGDLLAVFSDGVTEARSVAGEEFGEERLATLLAASRGLDAGPLVRHVLDELERFTAGAEAHDDLTLVVARGR